MARPTPVPTPAPARLARTIMVLSLVAFGTLATLNVLLERLGPARLTVTLACVAAVFALQYLHSSPGSPKWSRPARAASFAAQGVFTYLPMALYHIGWASMAGCLLGSALILFRGPVRVGLSTAVAASMLLLPPPLGATLWQTAYMALSTVWTGLILYALTWLTELIGEVHATRGELARLAVTNERLRFARDLHDLLGYSLSAITLKSELTHRLITPRPERASEEIASVLRISRQALADVRTVASGYREMSLFDEMASAASILAAADIDVDVVRPDTGLHPAVDTVLATALREGVTNILRHSKVERCAIAVTVDGSSVRLSLTNDGLSAEPQPRARHSGSGLGNLAERVAAIGGRLEAGARDDGRFHLTVEVPAEPPAGAVVESDETRLPLATV